MSERQLTEGERASIRRNKRMEELFGLIRYVGSRKAAQLFPDTERYIAFVDVLDAELMQIIEEEMKANPDIYNKLPEDENVTPIRPR